MEPHIAELNAAGDPEMQTALAVAHADQRERNPGDQPETIGSLAAAFFAKPSDSKSAVLTATIDGEPAGYGFASTHSAPDDAEQMGEIEIVVTAEHRRKGVATALADRLIGRLDHLGQTTVVGYPCAELTAEAGVALCAHYGMTRRQEERCSRAVVADIDQTLMDRWIADATTHAEGYRLEQWEGGPPEHLMDAWCMAAASMEDIPLDGVEYNPYTRDAAGQRDTDAAHRDAGRLVYRSLVLSPTGEPAGMTVLFVHRDTTQLGHQGDTGVLTAHRGHRLGRWLKAANLKMATEAHPDLAILETYNAATNPWMLDINVAMGFAPHLHYAAYQAPIATMLAATKTT